VGEAEAEGRAAPVVQMQWEALEAVVWVPDALQRQEPVPAAELARHAPAQEFQLQAAGEALRVPALPWLQSLLE